MGGSSWKLVGAVAAIALALLIAGGATRQLALAGQAELTSLTVNRPNPLEASRLRDGLSAASANDWPTVRFMRDQATDRLVRRILQWRYAASEEAPLSFYDISTALRELEDWPGRQAMRERAEQAILDSSLSQAERVAWLRAEGGPQTGDGRIALAQALRQIGQRREAEDLARQAWRENTLTPRAEALAMAEFSAAFSREDHAARVDLSLWREHRSAASRLMSLIGPEDRLVAQARIALQSNPRRGLQAAVDAVPASRREDPGFLYDRAQYVRGAGRPEDAVNYAMRISALSAPMATRDEIFTEKRRYIPSMMRLGDRRGAYRLVSAHGMTTGEQFADAEWLSGWLALRFLNEPSTAARHFTHLDENVSTPVSRARALYWRAEASRALGQSADADARLAEAARYDFTFYGQIASGRRGGLLRLTDSPPVSDEARRTFEGRELVRALRLIAEFGAQRDFEAVAYFLDDTLDNPQELELLANLAQEAAFRRTALRSAKAGLRRGIVAVNAAYPLVDLPPTVREANRPEPALVLAIIRQESEFDQFAVSRVGARGLMQLMPATARLTANRVGLSYQPSSLTSDPQYNITLGSAYLGSLIDDFQGSYVLALAAYNAGPSRAREWIADWGDPRRAGVDTVDWIELIPITETRNYVQRVIENTQVYRHRLAGQPTPISIEQDLRRGTY
jgi:soluble lytic murein transglycosylase